VASGRSVLRGLVLALAALVLAGFLLLALALPRWLASPPVRQGIASAVETAIGRRVGWEALSASALPPPGWSSGSPRRRSSRGTS
jgi:hypothetical protein